MAKRRKFWLRFGEMKGSENMCIWLYNNTNVMALICSVVAAISAVTAIIVSIFIANNQKKITLLETRIKIVNDIDSFVNDILPRWEWDGNLFPVNRYTSDAIEILFDHKFAEIFCQVISDAEKCNELKGDENYAQRNGQCKGQDAYQIEEERIAIQNNLSNLFNAQKKRAYKKWIKI